jgi:5-methylcytosine-specific restriction enzyme A
VQTVRAKRVCGGCKQLIPGGARCPTCTSQQRQAHDKQRGSFRARGYSSRWDALRRRFLAEYPLCGMRPPGLAPVMSRCHDAGLHTPATVCDHVVPVRVDPAAMWSVGNLQALCAGCHNAKTRAGQ